MTLRLNKRLPLALGFAVAGVSQAAVTYVDPPDIAIPATFEGVYLDLGDGSTSGSVESGVGSATDWTLSFSEPASGDWDINFFFGGAGIAHNMTLQPYREDENDNLSPIHNVSLNSEIDGGAIDPVPTSGPSVLLTVPDFGGSASGLDLAGNPLLSHMGGAGDQFISGEPEGYIAFVFESDTGTKFGWMQVTLYDDGTDGVIHRWAYSDDPILVGVPEPSAALLALLGAFGLAMRRRR